MYGSCDKAIRAELFDDAMGYVAVFVKFGKVFLEYILHQSNEYTMKFLLYVLKLTSNPDFDSMQLS